MPRNIFMPNSIGILFIDNLNYISAICLCQIQNSLYKTLVSWKESSLLKSVQSQFGLPNCSYYVNNISIK